MKLGSDSRGIKNYPQQELLPTKCNFSSEWKNMISWTKLSPLGLEFQDQMSKVPILNFVQKSEVFAAMFQPLQNLNTIVEEKTDGQPIRSPLDLTESGRRISSSCYE